LRLTNIYVRVPAEHDEQGCTRPLRLTWTDGRNYEIDRVTDMRRAPQAIMHSFLVFTTKFRI
jgi:hypothetical protein